MSSPSCRTRRCASRSEEHTSELQSRFDLVCRLLLEKKNDPKDLEDDALEAEVVLPNLDMYLKWMQRSRVSLKNAADRYIEREESNAGSQYDIDERTS